MIKNLNKNINNEDTVLLMQDNKIFIKSDAAFRISKFLGFPWNFFYFFIFIPKFIRDEVYEIIAQNRYQWFGKRSECMVPTEEIKSKFIDS
jgi:predicted DCC family thiol-disulfide oxidoreductase YuxK